MPPASAADMGSSDILPCDQVHRGFHLPSHTVYASRHAVTQNVLKKMHLNHLLVWEKKD